MRFIKQLYIFFKRLMPLALIVTSICFLLYFIIYFKHIGLLTITSSILEIYGVLIILFSEIESSSLIEKWSNPRLKNIKGSITRKNEHAIVNGKKENYYVGFGNIIFIVLYYAKEILNIWPHIKSSWYWLWHKPTEENCKITYDLEVIPKGSAKETEHKIKKIKEYPIVKILGFLFLFLAYFIQLIYILLTTKI